MDSIYALIDSDVVVNTIVWDGNVENWQSPEGLVAVLIPEGDRVGIGYTYDGEAFTAPPMPALTAAEILAINTVSRDNFLASATQALAPLQDAVDLNDASAAEIALLTKWKQYRVEVNRIVLTLANPAWPAPPA